MLSVSRRRRRRRWSWTETTTAATAARRSRSSFSLPLSIFPSAGDDARGESMVAPLPSPSPVVRPPCGERAAVEGLGFGALFFASRGRWSFFRRLGLPMRVGSRGNGAALRQAPFAGEPEGTPVSFFAPSTFFFFDLAFGVSGMGFAFDFFLFTEPI